MQEHVDLDVLELAPLCEREIAAVFSQVDAPPRSPCSATQLTLPGSARAAESSGARCRLSRCMHSNDRERRCQDWSVDGPFTRPLRAWCDVSQLTTPVLDWSYEPTADPHFRLAGTAYLAAFLEQVMHRLGGAHRDWSPEARDFLRILATGSLPAEWVRIIPSVTRSV